MTFSAADIVTILAAVGILAGVVAQQIINVMNAKAVRDVKAQVSAVDAKADVIAATTAKIDGHVNSEKTASDGREAALRREIELLRESLTDTKATAALLAQAAAQPPVVAPTTNGTPKATAQNAQKTDDR